MSVVCTSGDDMEKFKINLICNDSLKPSTSDKNVSQHTEWVYDGSGAVSLYVNQRSLDVLSDVSNTPKYIWLLESQQIISGVYEWIINNYDFVASRVDGIFSCDENLCQRYDKFKYCISNDALVLPCFSSSTQSLSSSLSLITSFS